MKVVFEKYIENLAKYKKLDSFVPYENITKEELTNMLMSFANEKRQIQEENNSIIKDHISRYEVDNIIDEEIYKDLQDFASSLTVNFDFLDCGLAYHVYHILYTQAKIRKDYNLALEYLYYYGYSQYLIESHNPLKEERNPSHFLEAENYLDIYDSLSERGKSFFLRSYGNMGLGTRDKELFDRPLKFILEKKETDKNSNIPYDRYILSLYRTISSFILEIRVGDIQNNPVSKQYKEDVLFATRRCFDYIKEVKNISLPVMFLLNYCYYAASFHMGDITLEELLKRIEELSNYQTDSAFEKLYSKLKMNLDYLEYLKIYGNLPKEELQEVARKKYKECFDYVDSIKASGKKADAQMLSIVTQALSILPFEECKDVLYETLVDQHKQTAVHVALVEKLSLAITSYMLETNPSFFIGVLDLNDEEAIKNNKEKIINSTREIALYHDIGKHYSMEYIALSHRNLFKEEFSVIKSHPSAGASILIKGDCPQEVIDSTYYHHIWHDRSFGYPQLQFETTNTPFIDILSVADSIDAATDYIGRPYAIKKNFDSLLEEFNSYKDTRYSGTVIEALSNPSLKREIERIISKE